MTMIDIKHRACYVWKRTKHVVRILIKIHFWLNLLGFIVMLIAAGWFYREFIAPPKVQQDTVLTMNLDGGIFDAPSQNPWLQRLLSEDIQTQQGVVMSIRKAAHDPRILAILMNVGDFYMGYETAQEIRDELLAFKQTGKKIFAYAEFVGRQDYFLASTADTIYLVPPGDVFLRGWRYEIPFYKDMLDKIGVAPEFIHIGKYKTAPQVFTMNHISDEYREVLNDILDAVSEDYIEQIAAMRDVSPERVRSWIDDGIYSAEEALEQGIVDELAFENDIEKHVMQALGLRDEEDIAEEDTAREEDDTDDGDNDPDLTTITLAGYARVPVDAPGLHASGEKIAVLHAQGSIVSGESPSSPYSQMIASETVSHQLAQLAEDDSIKGIIFRIDSGGGGARASTIIWNAVREATQKKPVVVSMVGAAASGGYMISAPADSIVAYPTTITGSIGIFGGKFSMNGLYDWIGLNIEILKRGDNAGIFTDARAWTDSEKTCYSRIIQDGYEDFVNIVAEGRGMTFEDVDTIAQGRVWTGKQALELGLVDALGGMETAITVIKEQLEIPAADDVCLVEYPKMGNPVSRVLDRLRNTGTAQLTEAASPLPEEFQRLQQQLAVLKRLEDDRLFAWFPVPVLVE